MIQDRDPYFTVKPESWGELGNGTKPHRGVGALGDVQGGTSEDTEKEPLVHSWVFSAAGQPVRGKWGFSSKPWESPTDLFKYRFQTLTMGSSCPTGQVWRFMVWRLKFFLKKKSHGLGRLVLGGNETRLVSWKQAILKWGAEGRERKKAGGLKGQQRYKGLCEVREGRVTVGSVRRTHG